MQIYKTSEIPCYFKDSKKIVRLLFFASKVTTPYHQTPRSNIKSRYSENKKKILGTNTMQGLFLLDLKACLPPKAPFVANQTCLRTWGVVRSLARNRFTDVKSCLELTQIQSLVMNLWDYRKGRFCILAVRPGCPAQPNQHLWTLTLSLSW